MELITGTPDAEFGDKTSLVANVTTRSGLGARQMFGNVDATYGSFGTAGGRLGLGFRQCQVRQLPGGRRRSQRPLSGHAGVHPFHDIGNNETIFDRFDYQPNGKDVFHLNLFAARNWIQIPNTYDQLWRRISASAC